MSWKGFFEGIQSFFENVAFVPFEMLRDYELENWWMANFITWLFILIGFAAFFYWMKQLQIFNTNNEEDRTQQAHSFLG